MLLANLKHLITQLFLSIKTKLATGNIYHHNGGKAKVKQQTNSTQTNNATSTGLKKTHTTPMNTLVEQYLTQLEFNFTDENKRSVPVATAATTDNNNTTTDATDVINSLDVHHFSMHISNQQLNWGCLIRIIEAHQLIAVYSILPIDIPKPLLPVILTLVSRINYDLIIGNFELDLNDGELRFKTSLDAEASPFTLSAFRHLLYSNFSVVSRYFTAFEQALTESKGIVEALDSLEKQLQDDNKKSAKGTTTKGYYVASDELQ